MGEIIKFNNSINKTNKRIKNIFVENINSIKRTRELFDDTDARILGELDYLEGYISDLLVKTNEKNWKYSAVEDKFIDAYDHYKKTLSAIEEQYMVDFFLSQLIYFSDLDSSILDEDYQFLQLMVTGISEIFDELDINDKKNIKKILHNIKKPLLKKNFKNIDYFSIEVLKDMAHDLLMGKNILTISAIYSDDFDGVEEEEDLTQGALTIERVYNCYRNQEDLLIFNQYNRCMTDEEFAKEQLRNKEVIERIPLVGELQDECKSRYLDLIHYIASKKNFDIEIKDVVRLTNLFLEMGNQISEFDKEDLIHYIEELGGKNENRRL